MTTFVIGQFFRDARKPAGYEKSYNEDSLLKAVECNFATAIPGYRDGVVLVRILPKYLRSSVVELTPDLKIVTTFESRVPGETPRKRTFAVVDELPEAGSASVVLYRADVLAEDNDRSSDADWEVVTVLAHCDREPEPMNPGTLMANHFKADGGTSTLMNAEQFEAALRESYNFWKTRILAEVR
jgi:hypothetical protein